MAARTGIVEETVPHPRLVVYPSRIRVALSAVFMILFVVPLGLGVLVTGLGDRELEPLVLGPLLVVGGLAAAVIELRMLWSEPRPFLVVDADGLWDRGAGAVPWSEVGEIGVVRLKYNKYVVVHIRDLRVLKGTGGPRPRLVRSNLRWLGAPIALASAAIPGSAEELIARIERYRP